MKSYPSPHYSHHVCSQTAAAACTRRLRAKHQIVEVGKTINCSYSSEDCILSGTKPSSSNAVPSPASENPLKLDCDSWGIADLKIGECRPIQKLQVLCQPHMDLIHLKCTAATFAPAKKERKPYPIDTQD